MISKYKIIALDDGFPVSLQTALVLEMMAARPADDHTYNISAQWELTPGILMPCATTLLRAMTAIASIQPAFRSTFHHNGREWRMKVSDHASPFSADPTAHNKAFPIQQSPMARIGIHGGPTVHNLFCEMSHVNADSSGGFGAIGAAAGLYNILRLLQPARWLSSNFLAFALQSNSGIQNSGKPGTTQRLISGHFDDLMQRVTCWTYTRTLAWFRLGVHDHRDSYYVRLAASQYEMLRSQTFHNQMGALSQKIAHTRSWSYKMISPTESFVPGSVTAAHPIQLSTQQIDTLVAALTRQFSKDGQTPSWCTPSVIIHAVLQMVCWRLNGHAVLGRQAMEHQPPERLCMYSAQSRLVIPAVESGMNLAQVVDGMKSGLKFQAAVDPPYVGVIPSERLVQYMVDHEMVPNQVQDVMYNVFPSKWANPPAPFVEALFAQKVSGSITLGGTWYHPRLYDPKIECTVMLAGQRGIEIRISASTQLEAGVADEVREEMNQHLLALIQNPGLCFFPRSS